MSSARKEKEYWWQEGNGIGLLFKSEQMKPLEITFLKPNIYFNLNLTCTWKCAQIRIPRLMLLTSQEDFRWLWYWNGDDEQEQDKWSRNEATMKTHAKTSPPEESTTLLETLASTLRKGNKSIRQISPLGPDEKSCLMFSTTNVAGFAGIFLTRFLQIIL